MALLLPDNSISFFQSFKEESEKLWRKKHPNKNLCGFQIQQNTKWLPGLDDAAMGDFEKAAGFNFPNPLHHFYQTMNGLNKPGINLYGSNGAATAYRAVFYSYPNDIPLIQSQIRWIYEARAVNENDLKRSGISRIFPIYQHRFMLVDHPGHPILSMYGDDIIYYSDSLSELLVKEIFSGILPDASVPKHRSLKETGIEFWLD